MRSSIPSYSAVVAPLRALLESIYRVKNSRTKRAIARVPLASSWGSTHETTFAGIKSQLARSTRLAHPRDDCNLCLFTDASESHWSGILTQVPKGQLKRSIEDQEHEPLSFLSGSFSGASADWSVPEKEGFAVVESMSKLDYLVTGRKLTIFTDHYNLVYLFDPYGQNPGIARNTASKLMRWALKLNTFRYVIEHMAGERNAWADTFSR